MHELGIMISVVDQVMGLVRERELTEVEAIVLEVGAMSLVMPDYLTYCFPAAADGTILDKAELRIEELPAVAKCRGCGRDFDFIEQRGLCPGCGGKEHELLSGKEFNIKEIIAR